MCVGGPLSRLLPEPTFAKFHRSRRPPTASGIADPAISRCPLAGAWVAFCLTHLKSTWGLCYLFIYHQYLILLLFRYKNPFK